MGEGEGRVERGKEKSLGKRGRGVRRGEEDEREKGVVKGREREGKMTGEERAGAL